ncbi:ferritin-like domain-containing protein [Actinoplanes sp. NBRC 103695]|uniref:ferritin-like domain-containing protein n=1 Tax=Actinoplanes sp. NBRC 103695 TaxID=3032202 RepID=UPI0025533C5E|nr:ferritin-like domain-containing protein [Actinoplanes sp. NBRC 103695]
MSSSPHRREIHDRALLDLDDGPVTPSNRAELGAVARLLNTVLAGLLVSALQFEQHALLVRGASLRPVAGFLLGCADRDRGAARRVAVRLRQLGFPADHDPGHLTARSPVTFRAFPDGDLTAAVTQNLLAARILVQTLQEAARWIGATDPSTRRLLEDLLQEKEDQADVLSAEKTARP